MDNPGPALPNYGRGLDNPRPGPLMGLQYIAAKSGERAEGWWRKGTRKSSKLSWNGLQISAFLIPLNPSNHLLIVNRAWVDLSPLPNFQTQAGKLTRKGGEKKRAFDFIWFCLVFSFSVEISFITSIFYCEFKWGCLFFFYGVSYSRGLAATRDLRSGELVLRVPKAVLLTRESVLNKDQKLAVSVNKYPHLSSTQVGFLSVAYWYCLLFLLSVHPTLLIFFHFSFCFLYFICYPRVIC